MRSLVRTLGLFSSGPFNNTRDIQLFKQVKDDVIFLGDLKAQKAIMAFASLGLFIPQNYLEYFATGCRLQQMKNLRQFGFQGHDEINQLQRHLTHKMDILPMQADEYICSLSATEPNESSLRKRPGGEIYYRDHSVHCAKRLANGTIAVSYFSQTLKRLLPAEEIIFNYSRDSAENHYIPRWAAHEDLVGNPFVSLSSSVNLEHMGTKKKTLSLDFISSRRIMASDFQRLLTSGNYVVVSDLILEAAEHLDTTVQLVAQSMAVFRGRSGKGCSAAIDYRQFKQAAFQPQFQPEQLHSFKSSCLPRLMNGEMSPGTYKNSHLAKCGSLLHFLLSIGVTEKPQGWANKFFTSTDYCGFLLLIPVSNCETESFCLATAFLYLQNEDGDQSTIMCSMIQDNGMGEEPFQCGTVTRQKKQPKTVTRQKKQPKKK